MRAVGGGDLASYGQGLRQHGAQLAVQHRRGFVLHGGMRYALLQLRAELQTEKRAHEGFCRSADNQRDGDVSGRGGVACAGHSSVQNTQFDNKRVILYERRCFDLRVLAVRAASSQDGKQPDEGG